MVQWPRIQVGDNMANHVSNYITVYGNDEVIEKFTNTVNKTEEREIKNWEGNPMKIQEHLAIEEFSFMPKYNEDESYAWYCDNVGAKWAHIEDGYDDYINVVSAWSPVSEFCKYLTEYLAATDPKVVLRHQYEDEFRNFIGVQVFWSDDDEVDSDYYEVDDSEISEAMQEIFPEWGDTDFDVWDFHEKYDCVPGERYDDWCYEWFDEKWDDLYAPFKAEEKEGSFYGYKQKTDNYDPEIDD